MGALPDRQVFEEAAGWYVQFQAEPPTPAQQLAWQRWVDSNPAHLAAWNQLEQMQRHLGAMPRDVARHALNPVQNRRQMLKLLLVLAGTGYVGWHAQQYTAMGSAWADYSTKVGQRRNIVLADGTHLHLNTRTAVDVLFDGQQRLIRLRSGEIFVRTGKLGDQRPLFVETREGRVQALGTRFSVQQLSGATRVGVLEDQVKVLPSGHSSGSRVLKAGEGVDFSSEALAVIHPYGSSQVAWINGQLIVLDTPLGKVLREIGRYRSGILQCDEGAAQLRVSGTFRLDSTDAVLANLQASLPISVRYFTRYWVSVSQSGSTS